MDQLAIVVVAYNRPEPLKVLLSSLSRIECSRKIDLIISIDNNGTNEVNEIANDFNWEYGRKKVIIHQQKKGLKLHFIWAGDLTYEYGSIVFLEDDLYVSPFLIDFCEEVIQKYSEDDRVAGASLYSPSLCEFDKCKFTPLEDGFDNYFFQHPYWGNVWQREKWDDFKKWLETYEYNPKILPPTIRSWGEKSFKKVYIQYLIEKDKFIVYPRVSCVTNMGETGVHCDNTMKQFQVSLLNNKKNYSLSSMDESLAVYDAFFEVKPQKVFKRKDYSCDSICMDLRGLRDYYDSELVMTTKKTRHSICSFSNRQRPLEENILNDIRGNDIVLSKASDIVGNANRKATIAKDILDFNYCISFMDSIYVFFYAIKKRLLESRFGVFLGKKSNKDYK